MADAPSTIVYSSSRSVELRHNLDKNFKPAFDEYMDNQIPMQDLKERLQTSRLPRARISRFVRCADANQDGSISYDEFVKQFVKEDEEITNQLVIQKRFLNKAVKAIAPHAAFQTQRSLIQAEDPNSPAYDAPDYNWGEDESIDNYIQAYTCRPPPIFIPMITLVQIAMFIYYCIEMYKQRKHSLHSIVYSGAPINSPLVYNPYKRYQVWRFLSYMLIHQGLAHLAFNCLLQLVLGTILELVHKFWRVGLVYLLGVIAGSLANSVTDPYTALVGASGGCYALIGAHLATVVTNWDIMQKHWLQSPIHFMSSGVVRLLLILLLGGGDTSLAIYSRFTNPEAHRIGFAAHFGGFLAGILLGIPILRNLRVQKWEKWCFWICLVLYAIFVTSVIVFNVFCVHINKCPNVIW